MRRLVALAALSLALVGFPDANPAVGQQPRCREQHHRDGSVTIECNDLGGDHVSRPSGPSEPIVPMVTMDVADGVPCIRSSYVRLSQAYGGGLTEEQAIAATAAGAMSLILLGFLPCPDSPLEPF